ncbi:hypothetical protein ABOM_009644 [Aspergillus bombycis]|uniref:RING-type domain-containing protein n=1 Tax=Aspergillus bombycis TaxID=109264 RepID=A0A1F7ZQU3_9EURO|nr:hypothetical protein ABOM_009644 [Aspergillus bombycis]OGM41826.1 hypothetical protein ABOM_009644 [Aspergillus bombycis]
MSRPPADRLFSDVADIINLHPRDEPWCAGYATPYGRRCHQRIPASDCTAACSLLDRATEEFHIRNSVYQFLRDLAPLVLCKSSHQNQAPDLIGTWGRQIQHFQTDVRALLDSLMWEEENSTDLLQMMGRTAAAVKDIHSQLAQLRASTVRLSTIGTRLTSTRRATNAAVQRGTEGYSSTRVGNTLHTLESPAMRAEPRRSQHPDITAMPGPGRLGSTGSTGFSVIRGQIEGECAICLMLLSESEHSNNNSEGPSGAKAGNYKRNQTKHLLASSRSCQGPDELLVWCKKRCGSNFHKSCMDQWTNACQKDGRRANCPMCRSSWNT